LSVSDLCLLLKKLLKNVKNEKNEKEFRSFENFIVQLHGDLRFDFFGLDSCLSSPKSVFDLL